MLDFLSEENIQIHKESVQHKKHLLSIIEKSIEGIKSKNIRDIIKQKMSRKDKEDTLILLSDIRLHELFFSSFSDNSYSPSEPLRSMYGSEAAFLNELFSACMREDMGFVCVYYNGRKVTLSASQKELYRLFLESDPIFAVDVSEHAYFLDYGFDKERYLRSALPYLDLSRIK